MAVFFHKQLFICPQVECGVAAQCHESEQGWAVTPHTTWEHVWHIEGCGPLYNAENFGSFILCLNIFFDMGAFEGPLKPDGHVPCLYFSSAYNALSFNHMEKDVEAVIMMSSNQLQMWITESLPSLIIYREDMLYHVFHSAYFMKFSDNRLCFILDIKTFLFIIFAFFPLKHLRYLLFFWDFFYFFFQQLWILYFNL